MKQHRLAALGAAVILAFGFQAAFAAPAKAKSAKTKKSAARAAKKTTASAEASVPQSIPKDITPLNSIAAEVNAGIITYKDIARSARDLRSNPANKDIPDDQLAQAAKSSLIERALLVDAARNQGLKASDTDIDRELARRAQLDKTTADALYQKAQRSGLSRKQFRIEVAKDIVIDRMMNNINDEVNISEAQLNDFIAKNPNLPAGSPYTVYTIRRIILKADSQDNMQAVGQRMEQIAQAVRQGSDFAAVAARYSQEPQSANGGLHDNITDDTLPAAADQLLHQMQPGQISVPVQSGQTWQMIQLVGSRTESDPAKIRREAARRVLLQQERQKAQQQFVGQLQHGAVVREY